MLAVLREFHFSSVLLLLFFFKPLWLERSFILKAVKRSLLHSELLTVKCLKIQNNIRRKFLGPAYFCVTEGR